MSHSNLSIAEAYYAAMAEKNVAEMGKYLAPDIVFIVPVTEQRGKPAVLATLTKVVALFNTVTVRTMFGSGDQVIVIYNIDFPVPIGIIKAAALLTFQDNLIKEIEIFYDPRPLEKTWEKVI